MYITSPAIGKATSMLAWTAWHQPQPNGTSKAWVHTNAIVRLAEALIDLDDKFASDQDVLFLLRSRVGELLVDAVVLPELPEAA